MIIIKEEFVDIINRLKKVNDFVNETNKKARELDDAIESDFFNASSLSISHETVIVRLLKMMFNDYDDLISWWIYEKDYGRKEEFKLWDGCSNEIDLSTPEKLYDYLIKEMEEKDYE